MDEKKAERYLVRPAAENCLDNLQKKGKSLKVH